MTKETFSVGPYELDSRCYYDPESHLWIDPQPDSSIVRCGYDPLGAETAGDVVAISFEPIGTHVSRGSAFGSLEAAKFVGPLIAPISGVIRTHNESLIANPGLINSTPFAAWMIEIETEDLTADSRHLLHDHSEISRWFEADIARFKAKGMVAE